MDSDQLNVNQVHLGAMSLVSGVSGSIYFDDFDSRRLSSPGTLESPYTEPEPTDDAGWVEHDYSYDDPAQPGRPHAVKSVDHPVGEQDASYLYDAAGNMTCRVEEGVTWVQEYNEENHISVVRKANNGCNDSNSGDDSDVWAYTYDGDGVRVKEVYAGTGTLTKYYFAGGAYEVQDDGTTTTTRVYYSIAGMRVAMEEDDGTTQTVYYFINDHLSSASVVTDASGTLLSENRYTPFGEVRDLPASMSTDDPITETDFGYTGQRNLGDIGLMDYNARFYSPTLGRFVQPDIMVPEPWNPQSFNRSSYTTNNPINYADPSGHIPGGCVEFSECGPNTNDPIYQIKVTLLPTIRSLSGNKESHEYRAAVKYYEYSLLLGHLPSPEELIAITGLTEWGNILNNRPQLAEDVAKATAWQYIAVCGADGCNPDELIEFLASFQVWYSRGANFTAAEIIRKAGQNTPIDDMREVVVSNMDAMISTFIRIGGIPKDVPYTWGNPPPGSFEYNKLKGYNNVVYGSADDDFWYAYVRNATEEEKEQWGDKVIVLFVSLSQLQKFCNGSCIDK